MYITYHNYKFINNPVIIAIDTHKHNTINIVLTVREALNHIFELFVKF